MLKPPAHPDTPAMLQLPYADCAAGCVVGYRGAHAVSNADFRARTAAWLQLLAAAPGRKFALFLEDSIDFTSALYGAWLAGKTVYLPGDTLSASCAALAVTVDGFLGDFDAAWSPLTPAVMQDAEGNVDALPLDHPLPPDFDGLVIYTSGTSGAAQAIPKRLSQLAAEVATLEQLFGPRLGDAEVLATVSHQHIYGLLFKILWPFAARRPVHARSAVFLEELLPWIASRPCLLVSSPAHLTRFPQSTAKQTTSRPTELCAVFSSGGPLAAQAAEEAATLFGSTPIEIYGSSETGGIAWRSGEESWCAMPGVRWRVHPDEGVLEVRSPHLPDQDWLRMADRAAVVNIGNAADDRAPRFILKGRTDRIVKLAEKRISLDAMERRLMASPLVAAIRVLLPTAPVSMQSQSGEISGERRSGIAAFVVLSDSGRAVLASGGKLALNRTLKAALSDTVAAIALPRSWRYLDALPLNAQGKTTQAELLALLTPHTLHAASASDPSDHANASNEPRRVFPNVTQYRQEANSVMLELHIPEDLLYFDGHFTVAPILPGVAQLNWAIAYGRGYFDLPPVFSEVLALKFQKIIVPNSTVILELQHEPAKSMLHFRLHSTAGQHASGRIVFADAVATAAVKPPYEAQGNV